MSEIANLKNPDYMPGDRRSSGLENYGKLTVIARWCGVGATLIGISGLLGWVFNIPVLTSIIPGDKPIAVTAAVLFTLIGLLQLLLTVKHLPYSACIFFLLITLLVTIFGLLETIQLITGMKVSIEDYIFRSFPELASNPETQISPVAGILILLIGLAQMLLLYQKLIRRQSPLSLNTVGVLGSLVTLISAVFLLSYVYRTPLLYSYAYIPIAALATIAGLFSGIGLLTTVGDFTFPLCWFSGASTRARLMRAFLPLTVFLLLMLSIVQYYLIRIMQINPAILVPVIVVVFEFFIMAVIVQVSRVIGNLLDRAEHERSQALEELWHLNETLEERVHQRTAALEAAIKELEAFSYSVSHDLRAPLRGIDGFSRTLLENYKDKLDEVGQDYLTRVRNAAQRMGKLIDDMLSLSRIGRAEMQQKKVDISALATSIIDDLRQREPERKAEIDIMPDMQVIADPALLRIMFDNLLANAWKFTSNKPLAKISFGMKKEDTERIYFISDNGAGFDMTYADKLFSPFQRLHTEKEFPGTGIGLAIVQRIIARHGGRVWAEGAEGGGATIFFTLGESKA